MVELEFLKLEFQVEFLPRQTLPLASRVLETLALPLISSFKTRDVSFPVCFAT